ncbi:MAG: glutamine--fructose-6-phosphate transaminase (isomerizing) [Acidobacteria bacterium]|nr:MAG: glutamine--fructose-6-phosphate transaminase (isomerizing) [Acidobacteriota bacterium]
MCGIVGYIGPGDTVPIIMEGLRRLEYRGYDSAGVAVVDEKGGLHVRRAPGKLCELDKVLKENPIAGSYGIGHTRWATHGRPNENNAHPHRDCTGRLVVAHNGIIENYRELKEDLTAKGHRFTTETDTEIVAHLIEEQFKNGIKRLDDAVRAALPHLQGAYALVVLCADHREELVGARQGPPLIIGLGENERFLASDIPAVLTHTRQVVFMDDGDVALLTRDGVTLTDVAGKSHEPRITTITWDPIQAEKGGYKHFMLKEIHEQPNTVRDTLMGRFSRERGEVFLEEVNFTVAEMQNFRKVNLVACGTSWHACLVGKFLLEQLAGIPVEVDYGSEFRYRDPLVDENMLTVVISQSGETADTLAALREAKEKGSRTMAICNVAGSMVTREAENTIYTHAGPEIGVASTKAFTGQLAALQLLALFLAQTRGTMTIEARRAHIEALTELPVHLQKVLELDSMLAELAGEFIHAENFLYIGRGINYPIALEGALKLKEISYIHAEGYPAGEMKHGPIALIDQNLPVVALLPDDATFHKMRGNIEEVKARGGRCIVLTTAERAGDLKGTADHLVLIPDVHPLLSPILQSIPLQLFAYHIALRRGCDVDQPRNLAKSVTVE